MTRPSLPIRVAVYVGMGVAIAATIRMAAEVAALAVHEPSRTFVPTLALGISVAYATGRTRPLRRLYDRLDDVNDRALRHWRKGDRLWTIGAGYIALHPLQFAVAVWRVKRDARAERRPEREAANRWQDGPARKPTGDELAELRERLDARP